MSRSHLTENQLELMDVLWRVDQASVQEVHEQLSQTRDIAQATVATTLNRLCKDGVVQRVRQGRQFLYRAKVARSQLQSSMLGRMIERLFDGDSSALLSHLVRSEQVSKDDLEQAQKLLQQTEQAEDPAR